MADIVFVDPVNTGFSRILNDAKRDQFFGVNEDIAYLARWLDTFVTRRKRWTSPKFLIGESYGTTRVAGLAARLQGSQWMYLNGVILVSPTGLGIERDGPVRGALYLPYYAATAWYHEALPDDLQAKDLDEILPEVEDFTLDELLPALARGGSLPAADRQALAERYARYSGLKLPVVQQYNMAVPTSFFWKELLRDQGLTVGRLGLALPRLRPQRLGHLPGLRPGLVLVEPRLRAGHQPLPAGRARVRHRPAVLGVRLGAPVEPRRRPHRPPTPAGHGARTPTCT